MRKEKKYAYGDERPFIPYQGAFTLPDAITKQAILYVMRNDPDHMWESLEILGLKDSAEKLLKEHRA